MSKIIFYVEDEGRNILVSYDSSITIKDFFLDYKGNIQISKQQIQKYIHLQLGQRF